MNRITSENLFNSIRRYIEEAKRHVVESINSAMVYTYYHMGKIIVEDEQNGMDRAGYAQKTLRLLSLRLNEASGKGYSVDNLESMSLFYLECQNPFQLRWSHYVHLLKIKDPEERHF